MFLEVWKVASGRKNFDAAAGFLDGNFVTCLKGGRDYFCYVVYDPLVGGVEVMMIDSVALLPYSSRVENQRPFSVVLTKTQERWFESNTHK